MTYVSVNFFSYSPSTVFLFFTWRLFTLIFGSLAQKPRKLPLSFATIVFIPLFPLELPLKHSDFILQLDNLCLFVLKFCIDFIIDIVLGFKFLLQNIELIFQHFIFHLQLFCCGLVLHLLRWNVGFQTIVLAVQGVLGVSDQRCLWQWNWVVASRRFHQLLPLQSEMGVLDTWSHAVGFYARVLFGVLVPVHQFRHFRHSVPLRNFFISSKIFVWDIRNVGAIWLLFLGVWVHQMFYYFWRILSLSLFNLICLGGCW